MRRVLVVWSVHNEIGKATAAELHWLLTRIGPDVLFLEYSSADWAEILNGSRGGLDSAAVKHYSKRNEVELVPVDLHLPAAELKPKIDEMFDRVEEASPRYCELASVNIQHTAMGGFAYLNSPVSSSLQSEMRRELRAAVNAIGEPSVTESYALWTRTNDLRERAMISGVEAFAGRKSFKKGVLLVGAAHQGQLVEKAQSPLADGSSLVTWDFEWDLEGPLQSADGQPDAAVP